MTDIVERLRLLAAVDNCQASLEAATEIERLRAEVRLIVEERDRTFALMLSRAERAEDEGKRLRAALWDVHALANGWRNVPIIGAHFDRIRHSARAALEGKQ